MSKQIWLGCLVLWLFLGAVPLAGAQTDPLPSWNEGKVKQSVLKFVSDVTKEGAPTFIAPAERVATFDADGTLWSEQPIYFQLAFAVARVQALAPKHPEWKTEEPFKSLLTGEYRGALAQGDKAVGEIIAATHSGMTTEEFSAIVSDWAATAKHPRNGRLYTEMVYQPMLELLGYLRSKGFKTYIVSDGGVDFLRPWVEKVCGIPPEQVVGSYGTTQFDRRQGAAVLIKRPKLEFLDEGPGKPMGIHRFIGRRPVLAFGNSDGDQQMLQWTVAGQGLRFAGIVHHTDALREWAYDKPSLVGQLDLALNEAHSKGWTVVSMLKDWKRIYPFDK